METITPSLLPIEQEFTHLVKMLSDRTITVEDCSFEEGEVVNQYSWNAGDCLAATLVPLDGGFAVKLNSQDEVYLQEGIDFVVLHDVSFRALLPQVVGVLDEGDSCKNVPIIC